MSYSHCLGAGASGGDGVSPDAQRIAIAQIMEWKMQDHPETRARTKTFTMPDKWILNPSGELVFPYDMPDFLSDLNACADMERKLTQKQWRQYPIWLAKVIAGTQNQSRRSGTRIFVPQAVLLSATAPQRCEAFLRTLDLWDDNA